MNTLQQLFFLFIGFLLVVIPFALGAIVWIFNTIKDWFSRENQQQINQQNRQFVFITDELEHNSTPCFLISHTNCELILQAIDQRIIKIRPFQNRNFNTARVNSIDGREIFCDMYINGRKFSLVIVNFKADGNIEIKTFGLRNDAINRHPPSSR